MSINLSNAIRPASELRRLYYGDGEVQEYAYDVLSAIEVDIRRAIENNATEVITEIETIFDIGQMDSASAQKHVYIVVANTLKKQGYIPKFKYKGKRVGKQKVFAKVTWLNEKDEEYDAYMTEELNSMVWE